MNGIGNAIVVLDLRAAPGAKLTPETVRAIADDPRTHFDQLMVIRPPTAEGLLAGIAIYNCDGSSAQACGNGMRCVALAMYEETGATHQLYEGRAGLLVADVETAERITVDMGRPRFGWSDIPLSEPFEDTTGIELQAGPIDKPTLHTPSVVNVGNPHAVFWVPDVDAIELDRVGPLLEHHPIFPERANITIAQILSPSHVRIRTWERGAGLTRACGSAACATAVCGARMGKLERRARVSLPGGDLELTWGDDDRILMTGAAEREASGAITFGLDGNVEIEGLDIN